MPSGPAYPALQVHAVIKAWPTESVLLLLGHVKHADPAVTFRYVPASQGSHGAEPLPGLYSPGEHSKHFVPSGPVYPMLQMQSVISSLPKGE
eukprot:2250532-Rhodomonas_salina.1